MVSRGVKIALGVGGGIILLSALSSGKEETPLVGGGGNFLSGLRGSAGGSSRPSNDSFEIVPSFSQPNFSEGSGTDEPFVSSSSTPRVSNSLSLTEQTTRGGRPIVRVGSELTAFESAELATSEQFRQVSGSGTRESGVLTIREPSRDLGTDIIQKGTSLRSTPTRRSPINNFFRGLF